MKKMQGKEATLLGRAIEQALHRKPETLDLSSAPHQLLDRLPVNVLRRLSNPTRTLVLPKDCPANIALRLMQEIGVRDLEPKSLMTAIEQAMSSRPVWKSVSRRLKTPAANAAPIRGGNAPAGNKPPAHRDEPVYDVPRRRDEPIYDVPRRRDEPIYDVPRRRDEPIYDVPPHRSEQALDRRPRPHGGIYETLSKSSQDIDAALLALRTLTAWSRGHAANEGQDPRCEMSDSDANALAEALRLVSVTDLKAHERLSWLAATVVLAKRQPGASLHVTPETVSDLEIALRAVQSLAADAGARPPALPPRRSRADGG